MIRRLIAAFAACAAIAALVTFEPPLPARAAQAMLCQGDVSGAATGARVVVNTSSTASPQPSYTLNPQGCALIAQADVGFFLSQGFSAGSPLGAPVMFTTGVATGTTDFVIGTLPAGAYILSVQAVNSTANAVTGGISIGSTANGTDIVAALTCAANCVSNSPGTSTLVKSVFAAAGGAATTLHAAAVTAWNNANVTVTVTYAYF